MVKKIMVSAVFFLFVIVLSKDAASLSPHEKIVRKPAVAGTFYPGDSHELTAMINVFLKDVPQQNIEGELELLVVPHAGYIYSGSVAAYSYKQLVGKKYDTVVVLALSHFVPFRGASIYKGDYYETPLGVIEIDRDVVNRISDSNNLIGFKRFAHMREHSLEVQLPFLQVVLGDFKLIPMLLGDTEYDTASQVAQALADLSQERNLLVVVSTDLSHYEEYGTATKKDHKTIDAIVKGSSQDLRDYFIRDKEAACGKCPLMAGLLYAEKKGADTIQLLHYANSGDTQGNKSKVVGYVSLAITKKGEHAMNDKSAEQGSLSEASKKELFEIVRTTIRAYLTVGKVDTLEIMNPELQDKNGVFVTLRTKSGALRGCIGNFVADEPLYKTVQQMAVSSAFRDPRFPPVGLGELDNLTVEISILSPMEKIDDPSRIELGKHGIYIKKGFSSGTFLPQVATETGWSLEEFLGHCSQDKAGIGWDGWKNADVYIYTADVIEEE